MRIPAWKWVCQASHALLCVLVLVGADLLCEESVVAQDLLNDNITFSGLTLRVKQFVTLPSGQSNVIAMTTRPDNGNLYVAAQEGKIYSVSRNANGTGTAREWFDVNSAVRAALGTDLYDSGNAHGGLRSVAFHPDFAVNGKFYVSALVPGAQRVGDKRFLGPSASFNNPDSAVAEFTFDHQTGQVQAGSYRELFRVRLPVFDHPIKEMQFNRFAKPGDEDYGLLYIAHGDASEQAARTGGGQLKSRALGKILRINPLQDGAARYTTPGNPFINESGTLPEIYSLGFRNPHTISFAVGPDGKSRLIVGNIGRDNIEEVEIASAGSNHGWSTREGTFVHRQSGGYFDGVGPLPENEAQLGYTYPAAQFDHDASRGAGFVGVAVATGHVIANGSDPALQGQLIFGDFGSSGEVYHADFQEMLDAVIKLDPNDPTRDEPGELTQAVIHKARLAFDHDNNPRTDDRLFDSFRSLLGGQRPDFRFGEGVYGEMYISTKRGGQVFIVTNSVPEPYSFLVIALAAGSLVVMRKKRVSTGKGKMHSHSL